MKLFLVILIVVPALAPAPALSGAVLICIILFRLLLWKNMIVNISLGG